MVYASDAQQGTAQRARESSGGVQDVCAGTVPVCVCVLELVRWLPFKQRNLK